jgi:hypothetical protein
MSDYKSIINIHCQANQFPKPEYIVQTIGGEAHNLRFIASVRINDQLYVDDSSHTTHKAAHQSAAKSACETLKLISPREKQSIIPFEEKLSSYQLPYSNYYNTNVSSPLPVAKPYLVLIDVENVQVSVPTSILNKADVHGFRASYSVIPDDKLANIQIHTIDSAVKDAADHYMTFIAAKLVTDLPTTTIIIIGSRDKTSDVLTQILRSYHYRVFHAKSAVDMEKVLNSI